MTFILRTRSKIIVFTRLDNSACIFFEDLGNLLNELQIALQEKAKEAEENAAQANHYGMPQEEECTIRTNAPPQHDLLYGSISEDMCGQCSKNSREALERVGSSGGGGTGTTSSAGMRLPFILAV